jgi:glutathione S-transferase
MRLITIPFSHYCEKARWALQHAMLEFDEDGHVPLLHWRASFGAGGKRTVPVLVAGEAVLPDSTEILRFADRHAPADRKLYPTALDAEVAALEERFDVELGPHTRRLAYYHALPHRALMMKFGVRDVPKWEALAMRASFPIARALLRRGMRIDDEGARISLEKTERELVAVDALLADGRRYLAGDRFTAADLTFAALASPLLAPPEHPYSLPPELAPAPLAELRTRFAATRAGQHALRMYREHRR